MTISGRAERCLSYRSMWGIVDDAYSDCSNRAFHTHVPVA